MRVFVDRREQQPLFGSSTASCRPRLLTPGSAGAPGAIYSGRVSGLGSGPPVQWSSCGADFRTRLAQPPCSAYSIHPCRCERVRSPARVFEPPRLRLRSVP